MIYDITVCVLKWLNKYLFIYEHYYARETRKHV